MREGGGRRIVPLGGRSFLLIPLKRRLPNNSAKPLLGWSQPIKISDLISKVLLRSPDDEHVFKSSLRLGESTAKGILYGGTSISADQDKFTLSKFRCT